MVAQTPWRFRWRIGRQSPDAHGRPLQPPCVRIRKSARHSRPSMQYRTTKASDRRRVPAEESCGERIISHSGEPCSGACLDGEALSRWRYPEPWIPEAVRQPLFVPHHGSRLGPYHDQDVRTSAVRCPDHSERSRVRRQSGTSSRHSVHKGGKLLHCTVQPCRSGQSRRYLVR